MTGFLRFLQIFSLGTWLGGIMFFSFILAPSAFGLLSSRDQPGILVGFSLGRLHVMGIIMGLVYLAATVSLALFATSARSSFGGLARLAALIVSPDDPAYCGVKLGSFAAPPRSAPANGLSGCNASRKSPPYPIRPPPPDVRAPRRWRPPSRPRRPLPHRPSIKVNAYMNEMYQP